MKQLSFEGHFPQQQGKTLILRKVMLRPEQEEQVIVIDLKSPASALQVRSTAVETTHSVKEKPE